MQNLATIFPYVASTNLLSRLYYAMYKEVRKHPCKNLTGFCSPEKGVYYGRICNAAFRPSSDHELLVWTYH